jgi:hypothetical protein
VAGEPKQYTDEQVDALVAERLAAETDGLKKNQAELRRETAAAKAKLAAYEGIDPEEHKKLKSAAEDAERKRLQGEGDFKQLETQLVTKYEGALEKERTVSRGYRAAVEKNLIDAAVATELSKHSDNTRILMPHVRSRMKVVEQDGEFFARVVDEAGNVRIGKGQGSSPMTLSEFVDEMKLDKDFAVAFRGSGSSGGGAVKPSGWAGGVRTIAADDNKAFLDNLADIAAGKVEVR